MESESLADFYKKLSVKGTPNNEHQQIKEWGHFNVFRREDIYLSNKNYKTYNRRDFYKISLLIGTGKLYYADKGIEINKNALLFSNPNIPYSWETKSEEQLGYFCLFTEGFINISSQSESLRNSPLFKINTDRVFFLDDDQTQQISDVFENMINELNSDYEFKYDLIKNYISLLVHKALKLNPAKTYFKHTDASTRITSMFLELLERQFPVSFEHTLKLKSAADYAFPLSVHINHLNRAVKKITGKTTTHHITSRIYQESKALLKHTDWNIADIAYCLGFENPAYFNNFFKKYSNITPSTFRQ